MSKSFMNRKAQSLKEIQCLWTAQALGYGKGVDGEAWVNCIGTFYKFQTYNLVFTLFRDLLLYSSHAMRNKSRFTGKKGRTVQWNKRILNIW